MPRPNFCSRGLSWNSAGFKGDEFDLDLLEMRLVVSNRCGNTGLLELLRWIAVKAMANGIKGKIIMHGHNNTAEGDFILINSLLLHGQGSLSWGISSPS